MERKMLVLDIDGTLTNSKKEITSKTKEAIIKLQKKWTHSCYSIGKTNSRNNRYSRRIRT